MNKHVEPTAARYSAPSADAVAFDFDQGQLLKVLGDGRMGSVVARTEHLNGDREYAVRFITSAGFMETAGHRCADLAAVTEADFGG